VENEREEGVSQMRHTRSTRYSLTNLLAAQLVAEISAEDASDERRFRNLAVAELYAVGLEHLFVHRVQQLAQILVCILLPPVLELLAYAPHVVNHGAGRDGAAASGRRRLEDEALKVLRDGHEVLVLSLVGVCNSHQCLASLVLQNLQ
jgi:hypothetical protein